MLPALQLDRNPNSCSGRRLLYPAAVFSVRSYAQPSRPWGAPDKKKKKKKTRKITENTPNCILKSWLTLSLAVAVTVSLMRQYVVPISWSVMSTSTIIQSDSHWKFTGKCVGSSTISDLIKLLSLEPTTNSTLPGLVWQQIVTMLHASTELSSASYRRSQTCV